MDERITDRIEPEPWVSEGPQPSWAYTPPPGQPLMSREEMRAALAKLDPAAVAAEVEKAADRWLPDPEPPPSDAP